ncbi:MAG TPA: hypothetical protein VG456_17685 [Candidatus Sulfopaludibacter sp.]|jgi:hypothetical protein|nr:hypothetical protein [Candidatus Sulfopaludibacter sp.]
MTLEPNSRSLRQPLALRLALMVLASVTLSHAAANFNAPNPSNAVNLPSYIDFGDNNCPTGGGVSGVTTNGGLGLTLAGSATLQGFGAQSSCNFTMYWQGIGSGAFVGSTATAAANIIFSVPFDVTVTNCSISVFINGISEATYTCTPSQQQLPPNAPTPQMRTLTLRPNGPAAQTTYTLSAQNFPVPPLLSSYSIRLAVTAHWNDTATTIFSVNVPGNTSIDILSQAGTVSVPALSPLALLMTGIMLLSLAGFGILRRESVNPLR